MMKTRKNLNELMSVIEKIRAEKYPDVPAELVKKIVDAQYENQEGSDRSNARTITRTIIAEFASKLN